MKKRVCFAATVENAVKAFLVDYIGALTPRYNVTVVTNTNDVNFLKALGIQVPVIRARMEREIRPFWDIAALFTLYRFFRHGSFDIVHSITPKSGLLCMAAAYLARVPVRIHTFTGQVWTTRKGLMRFILKIADRVIVFCATHVLVDSPSQRGFLIREKIISRESSAVIGNGSMCGVDLDRFSSDSVARKDIRQGLGIEDSDTVFLFLGRLTLDKGLLDLSRTFARMCATRQGVHLLIVGPDEENMKGAILSICEACSNNLHFEGYTNRPEHFMAASDIFCLPSYREGFGTVVIEASGVGIPSIGTRIYGLIDAIEDGITGFLYEPGDIEELYSKMVQLLEDPSLRQKMGQHARERVERDFSKDQIISEMMAFYEQVLGVQNT